MSGWKSYLFLLKMNNLSKELKKNSNLEISKVMGTGGGNGFGKSINFNTYSILMVWKSEDVANEFFTSSPIAQALKNNANEMWTLFLKNIKAHGAWDGENPFQKTIDYSGGPIAAITRAKINLRSLIKFWKSVPKVSAPLKNQKGLLFANGIGEYPYFMQATFSLWKDVSDLKQYAYNNEHHKQAIYKTKKDNWYAEELFAQFVPFKSIGSWENSEELESTIFNQ
jgi:hypothetical protein